MSAASGAPREEHPCASLRAVVPAALALAEAHPDCALPCPGCGSAVNAPNLFGHLQRVHAVPSSAQASTTTPPFTLTGKDGRTWLPVAALAVVWLAGLCAFAVFRSPAPPAELLLALLSAAPLAVLVALEVQGKLQTQLRVDGQRLVLRGVFGLGERVVALPARLESGRRVERRPAPPGLAHEHESIDHDAGTYLRLESGGTRVTVTAEKAAGLGKHWQDAGWTRGPTARAYDLRVSAAELVQLTHHLAALGGLTPKPSKR